MSQLKYWQIRPSYLSGTLSIPSSKSQSIRALIFALLAKGKSEIRNLLDSADVAAMMLACQHLGAEIKQFDDRIEIIGRGGEINGAEDVIQAGNSGLVLRFIGAIAAHSHKPIVITGDHSIRHNRPVFPLLDALHQLGVEAFSLRDDGGAPISIRGPIHPAKIIMEGADSQPVSGILITSAFASAPIEIFVTNPGEKPWVNLTLNWFDRLGISYQSKEFEYYKVEGNASIEGFKYVVPADFSSCAYPLVAALLTRSEITVNNLDFSDPQGDKKLIEILQRMGAFIEINENCVRIKATDHLQGATIDVNDCIDATPLLAVVGCFAEGKTRLTGAGIARKKESDRISAIACELKKMGAKIEEEEDGLTIFPSQLHGAVVHSYFDHRIALSLAVAAMAAKGETVIEEVDCVKKSYPLFAEDMKSLGGDLK